MQLLMFNTMLANYLLIGAQECEMFSTLISFDVIKNTETACNFLRAN